MEVKKLIRNDKVAVIYSPGFGAGWSTWDYETREEMLFDADLAQAVLEQDLDKAKKLAHEKWPNVYDGGLDDAAIEWIPIGTRFYIHEYDGSEQVVIIGPDYGYVA